MNKRLKMIDRIKLNRESFKALSKWAMDGNINYRMLPQPLEFGIFEYDNEEVLFDRNEDMVRFAWHKSSKLHASFEFNLMTDRLDNIRTLDEFEMSDEVYEPFFEVVFAYIGMMAFIIMFVDKEKALNIEKNGEQFIYHIDSTQVELKEMTIGNSIKGQLEHFINYKANWNRHRE